MTSLSVARLVHLVFESLKASSPLDGCCRPWKEYALDFRELAVTVWLAVMDDVTDAKAECKAVTERDEGAKVPRPKEVNCWRNSKPNPSPKPMACMRRVGHSCSICCAN